MWTRTVYTQTNKLICRKIGRSKVISSNENGSFQPVGVSLPFGRKSMTSQSACFVIHYFYERLRNKTMTVSQDSPHPRYYAKFCRYLFSFVVVVMVRLSRYIGLIGLSSIAWGFLKGERLDWYIYVLCSG